MANPVLFLRREPLNVPGEDSPARFQICGYDSPLCWNRVILWPDENAADAPTRRNATLRANGRVYRPIWVKDAPRPVEREHDGTTIRSHTRPYLPGERVFCSSRGFPIRAFGN